MCSKKVVNCPTCKKQVIYSTENPHRPFCSDRCRLIDLGQWLTESYRIESSDEQASTGNNLDKLGNA